MPTDTGRLKELNKALQAKAAEIDELANSWKDETGEGHFVVSTEQRDAYLKAITEAEEIKSLVVAEEKARNIHEFLQQPEPGSTGGQETAEEGRELRRSTKSLAEAFLESSAYQEMKESGFRNFGQIAAFETGLSGFSQKDVYSDMAGTIPINALGTPQNLGLTPRMLRPGRVRDLFPAESTTANLLYGIRESGFTNNAAIVSERRAADGTSAPTGGATDVYGLKPKSTISFTTITYPVATVAHILYAHRNTLDDEPRLRGLIDRDMVDGIKMVEDEQILYGDGVGDNLTGIINTPGVQTYTGLAADPRTAQIRRAMTRAILAYFTPTGVVVHPLDWEDLELETDNTGAYRLAVNIAVGGEQRMWRMNVVDTPAITEGQYLLGAFGTGAKLYDREQVNIQVSTENRDLWERNAVTFRAEERLAVTVDRPESFVVGAITTPT